MHIDVATIAFPQWLHPTIIPGLPFRWYGAMYLVAFAVTYALTLIQIRSTAIRKTVSIDEEIGSEEITNLFFWTIIGLVIGSRIVATTVYDTSGYYRGRPWLIFWPFDSEMNFTGLQGMSFHGGLLGAIIAFVLYCRIKKFPTLAMGDLVVAAVPLGYTFGRIGNFINGELYGRISALPWAMVFPDARPVPVDHPAVRRVAAEAGIELPAGGFVNLPRHPSQLYEALLEGVLLWIILWFVFRPRRRFDGMLVSLYLVGYSVARFIAEYFRMPDPGLDFVVKLGPPDNPGWLFLSPLNFTTGQIMSIGTGVAGIILYFLLHHAFLRRPRVETFESGKPRRSKRSGYTE